MFRFYEVVKHSSMREWGLGTRKRLVKVVPRIRAQAVPTGKVGYVTQERYLIGKNPHQLERDLGCKPNMLSAGASVFELVRLPDLHEFEYRLSTSFPNGALFDWAKVSTGDFERRNFWPPGAGIPQWEVLVEVPLRLIRVVLPFEPY